jgi:hypothetical protein
MNGLNQGDEEVSTGYYNLGNELHMQIVDVAKAEMAENLFVSESLYMAMIITLPASVLMIQGSF